MKAQTIDIKNIDIALDNYDDLFSDFDISPYTKRTLSEDFIYELIKRAGPEYKPGKIDVYLSIPQKMRNTDIEKVIIHRIKYHFSKAHSLIDMQIRVHQERGIKYILIGIFITLLLLFLQQYFILPAILEEILTVASWFSMWSGIFKIIEEPYPLLDKKTLYKTLASANYIFVNEEDITGMQKPHAQEMPGSVESGKRGQEFVN